MFDSRGGSRTAATSKMECFVIIVNGWKPLTIITKRSILDAARSILDVAAVLDTLLDRFLNVPLSAVFSIKKVLMLSWKIEIISAQNTAVLRNQNKGITIFFGSLFWSLFRNYSYLNMFRVLSSVINKHNIPKPYLINLISCHFLQWFVLKVLDCLLLDCVQ